MRTPSGPCPDTTEIERLASGDGGSADAALHVELCAPCRARLDAARDDAGFLNRVRSLAGAGLAPEGAPRIPGYRILGVVSSGSQGVVHRAMQESTSRIVAIKAIAYGQTASARQRYRAEREAEIAARLRHPNIVGVFESRTLGDGRIAVVMEFIDGVPLDAWEPPGATPDERLRELIRVFIAVCAGVHHAHLNGVIHRDLKPDNILVTPEGRPVLLDFGIAKARGDHATLTGEFAGTPAYASPEQVAGKPDNVDALTDVYSLGVILYRLLCRAMPYELDGSIYDAARTITETEPTPLRQRDPTLPADLEAITLRALRKEKERRYQSAAGLARDLERFLSGAPVEARSGSGWYLLRKAVSLNRRRLAWAGGAIALVALAVVAVGVSLARATSAARTAEFQRMQARAENVRARAVTELLRDALPSDDPELPELTSAVNAGLNRLHFRLETGAFEDDRELDQAVRRLWAGIYTGLGSGKAAGFVEYSEISLRSGLVRLRQEHGAVHPDIASTLHELGGVLLVRERWQEAEKACREAVAMRTLLLGPGNHATLDSRSLLARVLLAVGRTDEAEHEARGALELLRSLPGADSDLTLASLAALLAHIELHSGAPSGAEPLLREALNLRLRRLSPEDADLLASLTDAALFARLCPETALSALLCDAWRSTPSSIVAEVERDAMMLRMPDRGLFRAPVATGRTEALERLLRLLEAALGPNDPSLVNVLMAQVIAAQAESLPEVRAAAALRAAELLTRRSGEQNFGVITCLTQAASVYAFTERPERAVELARRTCAIWDSFPDGVRDDLIAATARRRLAWCLCLSGRHEEAIREYERAIELLLPTVGEEHHTVALAKGGLALCLAETGQIQKAGPLSEQALELALRMPTPWDQLQHIRVGHAHVLHEQGRHAEALALIEVVWAPYLQPGLPGYGWRRMLADDAAASCKALGDEESAERWRTLRDTPSQVPTRRLGH